MIVVKGENMNNRGFTLVEVIAIIVILIAIFLVSFPTIKNMVNVDEEKKYDNMVTDLCAAGKTYMYSNMDNFPELSIVGGKIEVKISDLIIYGNVDKDIQNPKSKKSIKDGLLRYQVKEDFSLLCEYEEGE